MSPKVVHIINDIDPSGGGAQTLLSKLHPKLLQNDVNSTVISICEQKQPLKNSTSLGFTKVYGLKQFWSVVKALKVIDSNAIIHVHLFPTVLYVAISKRFLGIKNTILFTEHSTSNRRRGNFFGRLLDKLIYNSIDGVIAISEGTAKNLREWMPSIHEKVRVIYNGIPLMKENNRSVEHKDTLRILSVGRLSKAKNYNKAIMAISQLKDVKICWDIAGEGELRKELELTIDRYHLQHTVKLLGHRTDLEELYQSHDLFLLPSSWEGFGLAAVEAMNHGMPVVLSDIPGLKEVGGEAAVYIDPESEMDIADKIMSFIQTPNLLAVKGEQAFEQSLHFDIEKTVEGHVKLYSSLT